MLSQLQPRKEDTRSNATALAAVFWHQQLQRWTEPAEVACKQDTLGPLNPLTPLRYF